jgi:hypothetical protein
MDRTTFALQAVRAAALVLTLTLTADAASAVERSDPEVVIEWNQLLEGVLPAAGLSPPRHYAMLHIAMFDAINSIERTHRPYRLASRAPAGASPEVAAAQAARDILVAQFPAAQLTFDAALQARISRVGAGQVAPAIKVGKAVAAAVLAWRQNDGWTTPPPPYLLPDLPGLYQPTSSAPVAFRQFQFMEPFALLTGTQYLPSQPPALTSEQYARDLEEVRLVGARESAVRTAEQTQLAQLFASVTSRTVHWALWNHVARDTARAHGLSLVETARAFALLNVAIHDGLQTSHTSKFIYGLWRPITAIQRADEDLNPLTAGDASWQPLLTTPAYPSHAGNMACVSASAARAMALVHGSDAIPFTAVWQGSTGNPDVSRQYASFSQLALDQANSRIYGGIHFRFENEASQQSCPRVADFVFARFMQPT